MVASGNRQQWHIQLEWHGARVSGSIMANGRTLLPKLALGAPSEAVRYVEWALVDMREGDLVELTVQRESPLRSASYRVTSPRVAVIWLEETLGVSGRDSQVPYVIGPVTVTLPKLGASDHGETAAETARPVRR
jgi:hypothetical protein